MSLFSKKYTLLVLVALYCLTAFAQKENSIWYFGDRAGLDFNFSPPKVFSNSHYLTQSVTVSDKEGDLLFYTDGMRVWNKQNMVMNNGSGLGGVPTNLTVPVIVKKPGTKNIYYILYQVYTQSQFKYALTYSIVDMSKNGGLGSVVQKNIRIGKEVFSSRLTVVKKENNCGYWLVTHGYRSNKYYAFGIGSAGIDTIPVISAIGRITHGLNAQVGVLVASNDGKKLASCLRFQGVDLFDFDNKTGKLTDFVDLKIRDIIPQTGTQTGDYVSCLFSPNNKYLYVGPSYHGVIQYDISSNIKDTIISSGEYVYFSSVPRADYGAMSLGPDDRIYIARAGTPYLSILQNPNEKGALCGYLDTGIQLSVGDQSNWGLQFYIEPTYEVLDIGTSTGKDTIFCKGESITLKAKSNKHNNFKWSTNETTDSIVIKNEGLYWLEVNSVCATQRDTIVAVTVKDTVAPNLGNDTILCANSFNLSVPKKDYVDYIWSTGSKTNSTIIPQNLSGKKILLRTTSVCGIKKDTIQITLITDSVPLIQLGNDTSMCATSYHLKTDSLPLNHVNYLWSTGDTTPTLHATQTGTYWVQTSNPCTIEKDTINITLISDTVPNFTIGNDTLLCSNSYVLLSPTIPNATYQWSNGDKQPTTFVNKTGKHWITTTTLCNTHTDTIELTFYKDTATLILGVDTIVCDNQLTLASDKISLTDYLWNTSSIDTSITVTQTGEYWLQATTPCSIKTDTIQITLITDTLQPINLGNDTTICGTVYPLNSGAQQKARYLWNTGDTTLTIEANQNKNYKLTISNPCYTKEDSITITLVQDPINNINIGNDTLLCADELELTLPNIVGAKYTWNTGDTTKEIKAQQSGIYKAQLTTPICNNTYTDSIEIEFHTSKPLQLTEAITLCQKDFKSVTLRVNADYINYLWDNGNTTPSIEVNQEGQYAITTTDTCGDTYTTSTTVTLCDCSLYVPNTFTPNKDNKNEGYRIINHCGFDIYHLKIYNRWGQLLFQTQDPEQTWDGTYDGKPVTGGIYLVSLRYGYKGAKTRNSDYNGLIHLLR